MTSVISCHELWRIQQDSIMVYSGIFSIICVKPPVKYKQYLGPGGVFKSLCNMGLSDHRPGGEVGTVAVAERVE